MKLTHVILVVSALAVAAFAYWKFFMQDAANGPNGPSEADGPQDRIEDFQPAKLKQFDPDKIEVDPELKSEVVRDQVLVTMHEGHTKDELLEILRVVAPAATVVGEIPTVNMFQVEVDPEQKYAVSKRLDNHPWIASATLNFVRRGLKVFNDPFLADEIKGWGVKRINAATAWDTTTGLKTTIAVVDSGTLVDHEEFGGKVVRPYSYATNSDKFQHLEYYEERRDRAGNTFYELDYVAGHGTHVAGTATGNADNSKGTAGIAPDAYLMPVQVLYFVKTGEHQGKDVGYVSGDTSQIVAGIVRAIAKGADVINLSLGPAYADEVIEAYVGGDAATRKEIEEEVFIPRREADLKAYKKALDLAKENNVILVNAAGNDNIPAEFDAFCFSNRMISVAATDSKDQRASFSNYGDRTTVSAPGVEIHSAFSSANDAYVPMPGTSMACPHVAGLVALMRAVKPDMTFEEAKEILVTTGTKLNTDQPIGPLVNAERAVEEAKKRKDSGQQPPADQPPLVPAPTPVAPAPPEAPDPPTPEEIVNGPAPWENPEVQRLIDLWLSIATPPLEPVGGRPWFYDEWARKLNNYTAWAVIPPDHDGMTRHQYVWQFAKGLDSVSHGTLYEFVLGMLRSGSFTPAPVQIPAPGAGPNPVDPGDGTAGGTPGSGGESPSPSGSQSVVQLIGQWKGPNEEGREIGLTIFDNNSAWSIQDGNPTPFRPSINTSETPAILELASEKTGNQLFAIEQVDTDTLKVCTYFNSSKPKFKDGDKRYTYVLKRVDNDPGDSNPGRYGFTSAQVRLRSVEQIILGSNDKNRIPGTGSQMPPAYNVREAFLNKAGTIAWVMIDNPSPAEGTEREPQVWHVDVASGSATRSPISVADGHLKNIRCTPDGEHCWAIVDYGLPQAVQPRREFRIMRATKGGAFGLIADTDKAEDMGSFGLAQDYQPSPLPGGDELIFNQGYAVWRASSDGFQKVVDVEQVLEAIGQKRVGSGGFREFHLSADGTHWIATLLASDGTSNLNNIVTGSIGGGVQAVASTKDNVYKPRISSDGTVVSYFNASKYETLVGKPGEMTKVPGFGKLHPHSLEFFGNGSGYYVSIGYYNSGGRDNGVIGSVDDHEQSTITVSGMMVGPTPGITRVSGDGKTMVTLHQKHLAKIELDGSVPPDAPGLKIEEVNFRVSDGNLTARVKVADSEQVAAMSISFLHKQQGHSTYALTWQENPFPTWARLAAMRKNEAYTDYFEGGTKIALNGIDRLETATFLIAIRDRDNRVANYLVRYKE